MKKNMNIADRIIRVIVAAIIVTLYATDVITGALAALLIGLSFIFVLTSLISFCPLYILFGMSTLKKKPANK